MGMSELKKAILNADIENHGDKIEAEPLAKKEKKKAPEFDPYEHMADKDFPEVIPGMTGMQRVRS